MASSLQGVVAAPGRATTGSRPGVWLTELLLLTMALIWGVNYSVAKYATGQLAPLAFNGVRVAAAAVALLVIAAAVARVPWPSRRDTLKLLGLGVLGNCVYQVFFIEGVARTGAGTAALILAATPAVIALMSRFGGVERVSRRTAGGIALSIAGVALVMFGRGRGVAQVSLAGNLLMFAGCVSWAAFTVLLKPYTDRVPGLQLSAITMTGGAIPLLVVAAPSLAATRWADLSAGAWAAVVYGSLAALVVAYVIWYRGVRVIGPTRTAMFGNLQPFIALGAAWFAFGDVPSALQLVGAAGITGGILLTRG
jgi:drug/metabolite transporter (DMT)-like permease